MRSIHRPAVAVTALAALVALAFVGVTPPDNGDGTPTADGDCPTVTTVSDATTPDEESDGSTSLADAVSPGGTGSDPDAGHTLQAA